MFLRSKNVEEADVQAHAYGSPRNGQRGWLDKIFGEGIRLFVVLVIALGVSYLALSQRAQELSKQQHAQCRVLERLRVNQQTVLFTLLGMIDILNDRSQVGLAPVPISIRRQVLSALTILPNQEEC